ncbi:MAG: hypothetical protein GYA80_02800, partial [Chloroflexi bacterium]|nr:hypothetical protein [Chloroflexota bacterium]
MKTRFLYSLMALLMVLSLALAACTTTAPATQQPTEVVTEAPFVPMKVEAPNCDYGGEFKSIEA